jgi:hypothetical protein
MTLIDRRSMMRSLFGGVVAAAAVSTVAAGIMSGPAGAMPRVLDNLPGKLDNLVREAQVVERRHRHRHRRRRPPRKRWVCRWHRGRRVCGWTWW